MNRSVPPVLATVPPVDRRAALSSLSLAALAALAVGCGGGPAPVDAAASTDDTSAVDAPVLDGATIGGTRTTIGAAGGVARSADGLFEIFVAAGALIRRTESGMSMPAGGGPGMPFPPFTPLDDPTTDNPPALRYLRSSYRNLAPGAMPGGVLTLQLGAVSPELQ